MCFRGRSLQRTSLSHQPASLGAKCCANYCMTPPSISVLMEIHNLWHILASASGDLNAIILLKWDLIGQLLSHLLLWSHFFKCPSIAPIMYHCPAEQTYGEPDQHQLSSQNGNYRVWLRNNPSLEYSLSAEIFEATFSVCVPVPPSSFLFCRWINEFMSCSCALINLVHTQQHTQLLKCCISHICSIIQ